MNILIINAGSSSLKYQFFRMPSERPVCTGLIEKIGAEGSFIRHKVRVGNEEIITEDNSFISDHSEGLNRVIALLSQPGSGPIDNPDQIDAIGHRVVHGGEYFSAPAFITAETKRRIRELSDLAPLHNPASYKCIEIAEATFRHARQVAIFDTAFHQTIPEYAFRYAIPESYYNDEKIRAYGFHGTSHDYVSRKAMQWLDNPSAKIISIHLGNGCSITAVDSGKSVDTSMGFGPLSGLIMGTRSGDIDPSVVLHLLGRQNHSAESVSRLLNKHSGLLGFTGSNDMRDVHKMEENGSRPAKLILEMYAYRIKKYIGSYIAVLNGIDAIVFTAGVGENDSMIRESICSGLDYFNIRIDNAKNRAPSGEIREISDADAKVKILAVPTNEELEMAQQTYVLCTK